MDPLHILIVEDDENDVILLQKELRAGGLVFESKVVDTHADFVRALEEAVPDLIIADFQLPRFDALTALELSQHRTRRTPFIIFTGCLDEATAVLCMKLGAWDYVLKQNPVRLVACIRSALERRRLVEEREHAVREGEQRFRQIADVAPVLIWMTDPAGTFQYFNRAWLSFTGRSELVERNGGWLEGIHPADRNRCKEMLQSKIETLQACQIEFRLKRHDGSYRWILCNGSPYYLGKDRFSGYIGSGVDITDIKDAENERSQGLNLAAALIENMQGPAYAKDSSGRYIVVNHPGSLLLGRGKDAFRGKSNSQLGLDIEFPLSSRAKCKSSSLGFRRTAISSRSHPKHDLRSSRGERTKVESPEFWPLRHPSKLLHFPRRRAMTRTTTLRSCGCMPNTSTNNPIWPSPSG